MLRVGLTKRYTSKRCGFVGSAALPGKALTSPARGGWRDPRFSSRLRRIGCLEDAIDHRRARKGHRARRRCPPRRRCRPAPPVPPVAPPVPASPPVPPVAPPAPACAARPPGCAAGSRCAAGPSRSRRRFRLRRPCLPVAPPLPAAPPVPPVAPPVPAAPPVPPAAPAVPPVAPPLPAAPPVPPVAPPVPAAPPLPAAPPRPPVAPPVPPLAPPLPAPPSGRRCPRGRHAASRAGGSSDPHPTTIYVTATMLTACLLMAPGGSRFLSYEEPVYYFALRNAVTTSIQDARGRARIPELSRTFSRRCPCAPASLARGATVHVATEVT